MRKGFTLIELLVVIAILGALVAVIIAALNPFTQIAKSRDIQRRTTLKQIQNLLEQYYNDNGSYPTTAGAYYSSEPGDIFSNNSGNWIPGLSPTYINILPRDPLGGTSTTPGNCVTAGAKRAYLYRSDGNQYALYSHCAPEILSSMNNPNDAMYSPNSPTYAWRVCAGSTACTAW